MDCQVTILIVSNLRTKGDSDLKFYLIVDQNLIKYLLLPLNSKYNNYEKNYTFDFRSIRFRLC